jgi:hypothetical protein
MFGFESLIQANKTDDTPPTDLLLLSRDLAAAFGMGLLIALIYFIAHRKPGEKPNYSFLATLILLTGLVGLVTIVIGNSIARAFLVGALAIVRFRTIVEDTRDTAFVIFSVAAGMAAGAGYFAAPLLCMPLVLLVSWALQPRGSANIIHGTLTFRLGVGQSPNEELQKTLQQHLQTFQLSGLSTARGGSAVDTSYSITAERPEQIFALVQALNRIEGVQSVEVRTQD